MNRVFGGPILLAVLTVGVGSWADSPMTPVRAFGQPSGASQWVEPPPAVAEEAAPARAALDEPTDQHRTSHPSYHRAAQTSRPSSDHIARLLNRQELTRLRSGGGYSPSRGYWPGSSRYGY